MLISVVIPCYNVEKFIDKCLNSILKQTYKNLEIILYDDCSEDKTNEILKTLQKKDGRIKVYFGKENAGPGGAKNEGLKRATGDYVLFIDSDDYVGKTYIEEMVNVALKNPALDIITTNFTKIDQNGKTAYIRDYKNSEVALWQKITTWGKLFKREWLTSNTLSLPYGKVLEDVLFHGACMIVNPKSELCHNQEYYYVFNSHSISHTTLNQFKPGALKQGQEYLISLKNIAKTEEKEELLSYFAFQYICWHLLKSGNNVGKEAMEKEYNQAFSFLEIEFPKFKKNRYISIFHPQKERRIIFFVMYNTKILYKLHLAKFFFKIYSRVNLEKLWPNL